MIRIILLTLSKSIFVVLSEIYRVYIYFITEGSSFQINVHPSVEVKNSNKVKIGKRSIIKKGVILNGRSNRTLGVELGNDTCIKEFCYIDSYNGRIQIDGYGSIGQYCVIAGQGEVKIGKYVMIGAHTYILSSNHVFSSIEIPYILQGDTCKPVTIEDNVWIGGNVIILCGVTIGKNSVIGAGSIVNRNIPPNTLFYNSRHEGKFETIKHKQNLDGIIDN